MTNVQQPEMRRSGRNPTVQDSKRPDAAGHPRARGRSRGGRPVPPEQVSGYGPATEPVSGDADRRRG